MNVGSTADLFLVKSLTQFLYFSFFPLSNYKQTASTISTHTYTTALKDAKTWTSDAKRAAKERREAKQREGGDKKETKAEDKAPSTTAVEFAAAKLALESAAVLDAEEVVEEKSPKADKKKDKKKAAKPAEEEEASGRRSSKRRQLPLGSSTPPSKKDKKGGDSAVSGLHLLSQATHAVAGKKKGRKVKAETVAQV